MSYDVCPFVLDTKSGGSSKAARIPAGLFFYSSEPTRYQAVVVYPGRQNCENPAFFFFELRAVRCAEI